jgi:hypothetical protein
MRTLSDEIAIDRILNRELGLTVVHRDRPEGIHRRELILGESQREIVLTSV